MESANHQWFVEIKITKSGSAYWANKWSDIFFLSCLCPYSLFILSDKIALKPHVVLSENSTSLYSVPADRCTPEVVEEYWLYVSTWLAFVYFCIILMCFIAGLLDLHIRASPLWFPFSSLRSNTNTVWKRTGKLRHGKETAGNWQTFVVWFMS